MEVWGNEGVVSFAIGIRQAGRVRTAEFIMQGLKSRLMDFCSPKDKKPHRLPMTMQLEGGGGLEGERGGEELREGAANKET